MVIALSFLPGPPELSQGGFGALVSVFPDDGVKNLTAVPTPPSPEGSPVFIIFLFDHTFPAAMAFMATSCKGC